MRARRCSSRIGLAAASLALASGLTLAQEVVVSSAPAAPSSFGPNTAVYSIPVDAFSPVDSATTWNFDISSFARYRTGGVSGWFDAPVNLPSGARIDGVAIEVYDNDPAYEISSWLGIHVGSTPGTNANFVNAANTSGTPGWTYVTNQSINVTVDNLNNAYFIQVNLYTNAGLHKLRRVLVYYHLQVSPAPLTATFGDVPTGHPQFQFIEALVASGVTAGCGSGNYCPSNPLTRGQMAVFLSKLVGLYWAN